MIYSWVKLIEQNGKIEIRVYISEETPHKISGQMFVDMFFNSGTSSENIDLFVNEWATEYYNSLPEPIVEEENG